MTHEAALLLIEQELKKARNKHPNWPGSESKQDVLFAAAIVGEESGELIRAAVQFYGELGSAEACFREAIQTAACCFRFLEGV
jgi:NTP pyrophosphatase (non-canonical NTP hydrolase)